MQHLEKRVLSIRTRLAPDDRRGGEIYTFAGKRDRLSVAFHFELLQVRRKTGQAFIVWQDRERRKLQETPVPHAEYAHQHRQILLEGGLPKVPIDRARAAQEFFE